MGEQVATPKQANTETPPEYQLFFLYIVLLLHFTIYYSRRAESFHYLVSAVVSHLSPHVQSYSIHSGGWVVCSPVCNCTHIKRYLVLQWCISTLTSGSHLFTSIALYVV